MNVLLEQDGMGILVPHLINAQMEKNGIFSLLHVNVLLVQSGMELSASSQLFAVEANSLTPTTSASALKIHSLKMEFASKQAALGDRFGTDLLVYAIQDSIGMEHTAFFVLMDRIGTQELDHVDVQMENNGMVTSVKNF